MTRYVAEADDQDAFHLGSGQSEVALILLIWIGIGRLGAVLIWDSRKLVSV